MRYAELGTVYRYERSGTLHGMLRVRGFTQDDAHIFCTPEQVVDEAAGVIELAIYFSKIFGYEFKAYLATRPEKFIGDDAVWDKAERELKAALERHNLPFEIDAGGGAFYGPKIDIKWVDALGREWTGPTIQAISTYLSASMLTIVVEDGKRHRAVMILDAARFDGRCRRTHRALRWRVPGLWQRRFRR
ncbi:MAG: aminoacyl--tRNA ligase-related protein [Thermomicrobiales bacterium]